MDNEGRREGQLEGFISVEFLNAKAEGPIDPPNLLTKRIDETIGSGDGIAPVAEIFESLLLR